MYAPEKALEGADLTHPEIILVYQMGKVGSSSVHSSLLELQKSSPTFHIHTLNNSHLKELTKVLIRPFSQPTPRNLLLSHCLIEYIKERGVQNNRWKIVTMTRDPIATTISALFQIGRIFFPNYLVRSARGEISIDEVSKIFLNTYPFHDWPLNWFDDEIKHVFGVDVYEYPFPHNDGYIIRKTDHVDLLVLRLESLHECGSQALSEFLGTSHVVLRKENDSKNKPYSALYKRFKKEVDIPRKYIRRVYSHKYTKHFYTCSEIEGFRRRWER